MTNTKTTTIIYWTATIIIFLMEGVMPAFTGNSDLAKEGIKHLGYPDYFRVELNVFKVIGALVLILPMAPARLKEWAYAGFGIVLISAFISHLAIDGAGFMAFMPLIFLGILVLSYIYHSKMKGNAVAIQKNKLAIS